MIAFRLAPGVNCFEMAYAGNLVRIEAGEVFETADPRLAEELDRQPAVERVKGR